MKTYARLMSYVQHARAADCNARATAYCAILPYIQHDPQLWEEYTTLANEYEDAAIYHSDRATTYRLAALASTR